MDKILELLMENPEMLTPVIKEYIRKYKPIVYSVIQEIFDVYKDFANNEDYFKTVAKVKMNIYDAYINAGFTDTQAMALILNDNLRLVNSVNSICNSVNKASELKSN